MQKMNPRELIGISILSAFFLLGIFIAHDFNAYIIKYLDFGILGMITYVVAGIIATVIAPVSTVPVIPLVAVLWGPFLTALLSIIAWSIGSVFAFLIARYFGKPIISHFINLETISAYEKSLGDSLFWDIVLLRMAVPVDILSYAIGLFSSMRIRAYIPATIIGITPFAFLLSYSSRGSFTFQIIVGVLIIAMMYLGYRRIKNYKINNSNRPNSTK